MKESTSQSSVKDIEKFLAQTGYIFEMRASEFLQKRGYETRIGNTFRDLESGKDREIDLIGGWPNPTA